MRVMVVLVALLYVLAALYGYFWWKRPATLVETQAIPKIVTAPEKLAAEQLRFADVKLAENGQLLVTPQLQSLQTKIEARLTQLELQQATALKNLQAQVDELKKQQEHNKLAATTKLPSDVAAELITNPSTEVIESAPDVQVKAAKQQLAATISQLDVKLQTEVSDLGRQSLFQQKLENAFAQAELANVIQGRTECGLQFCRLDLQGKAPTGVDVLQVLWEQQVFPEATEVMTVPKLDGSGWLVYVAAEGRSLSQLP